ncbi:hypothetical protein AALP_AAs63292U000100 [Arabis alpina]|uniref:Uncharacterized protein n=1 Tax=Arabis alpina TaxID=50452 RepID=A0A087G1E2_ARAAL|nr:hypothetical protein AALP_AAs63292U000100 [Arabis alpina]
MDSKRLESVEEFGIDPDNVGRTTDGIRVVAEDLPSSRVGSTMMRVASGILHLDTHDVVGDDAEKTPMSRGILTPTSQGILKPTRATTGTSFPDATNIPMCMPDADIFEPSLALRRRVDDEGEGLRRGGTDVDIEVTDGTFPLNVEDPGLPLAPLSSSSTSSQSSSVESDDEDTIDEVQQSKKTKKAKKKAKVKVRPNLPWSSLSDAKSLQRFRRKCGISEEIALVAPSHVDKADAPPPGYMNFINPRGIRHLLGIYVLSKECGVAISTEHLSYLTDFRVCGRSEELKHTVTNSSGMELIAGFPSKDDNFEDPFFFVEISERTVEADCIDLVKTKWERRANQHLRGDTHPATVIGRETSASLVCGLVRDEAYPAVKSKPSELSLFFDRLVGDYDEDVCSTDSKLSAAKEAYAVLQSRQDDLAERNEVLERDVLSVQKVKKDYEDKLTKLKSRCTKAEGEVVQLRGYVSTLCLFERVSRSTSFPLPLEVRALSADSLRNSASSLEEGGGRRVFGAKGLDYLARTDGAIGVKVIGATTLGVFVPNDLLTFAAALSAACSRKDTVAKKNT